MNKYSQFFGMQKEYKELSPFMPERDELVSDFSDEKYTGLSELTTAEYDRFLEWFKDNYGPNSPKVHNSPENNMRRKVIAIMVHQLHYDMAGLENWCVKYGKFKKKLNDHDYNELVELVTQVEQYYQRELKK